VQAFPKASSFITQIDYFMPLREQWFPLPAPDTDSLDLLLAFLEDLPKGLNQFIDADTSDLEGFIQELDNPDLTYAGTVALYEEASTILYQELAALRALPLNGYRANQLRAVLAIEGLTGDSLRLKLSLLNALWEKFYERWNQTAGTIFTANGIIKRILKKFLDYLNALLESIGEGLPGTRAIKELKEVIEGYLDLDED
jgi:hypothetical protein